jgi:histidinol-phosphate aminotransferase
MTQWSRRAVLKSSGLAVGASLISKAPAAQNPPSADGKPIHLNLNENAFGASPRVPQAIQDELSRISRYADAGSAEALAEQIAAYERVPVDQIVLGEILGALGLYLGSNGGPGGEFVYSTPGYLALIDAASRVGGVGVPVPLNAKYKNDLPALAGRITSKTRAIYLINPHNPTGTVNDDPSFKHFLRDVSQKAPVIVDEAYLEYTADFETRSAVSLVREGADVLVFRTFDKIYGLAGLPIGYSIVPRALGSALRKQGLGDAESLGRLNIAAASAALADQTHVRQVRSGIAAERQKWTAVLDDLKLTHTDSQANFIFFNANRPQEGLASALRDREILIGRSFPPYVNWVRITIGRPEENSYTQQSLRAIVRDSGKLRPREG